MLRANLEDWLSYGPFRRAATWLKIVNRDSGMKTTSADAVLAACDDMPTVTRPGFL